METFEEVVARLAGNAETPLAPEIITELNAGYANDISVREAAIAEREAQIAERDALIAEKDKEAVRLKAVNYDLLVKTPATRADTDNNKPENQGDKPTGISSMFEEG
jgi:glycyl-tRNA synthetase (class II)